MCACFLPIHSGHQVRWTYQPGSHKGHTGFLIHLLSAVRAFIFLARRIQPFLSLVDCEVEFCVLTIYFNRSPPVSFSTRWAFLFSFFVFARLPGSNSRPNVSEGYEVPLSYRGDRLRDREDSHKEYWKPNMIDVQSAELQPPCCLLYTSIK